MSASQAEQLPQEPQPLVWGNNLAPIKSATPGLHNDFLIVYAERPNGTIAEFGEVNKAGFDGAHESLRPGGSKAEQLAPGRSHIYKGVRAVMELEKLLRPEVKFDEDRPVPRGDWDPELDINPLDLTRTLQPLALRRKLLQIHEDIHKIGGVDKLNEVLAKDSDLAVGLQKDEGLGASIIKLQSFQEIPYIDPVSGYESTGLRVVLQDRHGDTGLRPEGAHVERLFIKRN